VQTHQINVSSARDMVQEIRHELFAFPEVLDVFVTGRPDWLVVVSRGRPRPGEWLGALRAVGYHVPVRRHATQAAEADRQVPVDGIRCLGSEQLLFQFPPLTQAPIGVCDTRGVTIPPSSARTAVVVLSEDPTGGGASPRVS